MSVNGVQFMGGLETLGSIEAARDVHEAAGIWWAQRLLDSRRFNNGSLETEVFMETAKMPLKLMVSTEQIEANVGGFAGAVEYISRLRQEDPEYRESHLGGMEFRVDYAPDVFLKEAAELTPIAGTIIKALPWKTFTDVNQNGVLYGRQGMGSKFEHIWPPETRRSKIGKVVKKILQF